MNITVTYMRKDILGNANFITDKTSNATEHNLINVISYFICIKDKYNSILVNHPEYLEFVIKYTNIKINNVTIYYSSVQNLVDNIITIKSPSGKDDYKIKEMQLKHYLNIIERQIYRMKRHAKEGNIEFNIDNLILA